MALLRKEKRSKNAKAIKQVILLSLPGNIFREKVVGKVGQNLKVLEHYIIAIVIY